MRIGNGLALGAALALAVTGCGGDDGGGSAAPPPIGSPAPAPAPTPTPPPTSSGPNVPAINDSFVRLPPVFSTDSARYGRRTFQGIPTMVVTGNRIWLSWVGGSSMPAGELPGDHQTIVYSDDGGTTWSREFYLVPQAPATDRLGDARLWQAPDGKLWMFFFQSGQGKGIDSQLGTWLTVIADPTAAEPVFETPVWIGDGIPNRPFRYNDQWLVPLDYPFIAPSRPERAGQHLYSIDWANRRFTYVTTLPRNTSADFNEPALVQLRDGSVLLHQRTTAGLVQRTTPAGAWRWSNAVPFVGFPTVQTRSAIERSPTGRLIMVTNKSAVTRENMTIAISEDEGRSWPYQHTFEARAGVSYPDIAFAPNGDILVVFDYGRFWGQIRLARIKEASIVAGQPEVTTTVANWARAQ